MPKTFLTALLLCLALPASGQTLRGALDAAWARSPEAGALAAQRGEIDAQRHLADRLMAGPPALELAERSDRWQDRRGQREIELEISAPLWLPGQRDAQRALASGSRDEHQARLAALRLQLAGELREAVRTAANAADAARLAGQRLAEARALEDEVERRLAAGELARTDALAARLETRGAETEAIEAQTGAQRALQAYRLLTGLERLPEPLDESLAETTGEAEQPRLAAAERAVERARAQFELARRSPREAPELALQWSRGRELAGEASQDSLRIALRIPFASEARNAPLLAAANSELIRAEGEARRVREEIASALAEARIEFAGAESALRNLEEGLRLADEHLALVRKGFALGELPLAQLLRAQALAREARGEQQRQRNALQAAIGRINQALGHLP